MKNLAEIGSRQAPPDFSAPVLTWYEQHGRKDLPWQIDPTPYRVWVSEIMLQQTQVATVVPYFDRFMACFPDIGSLAQGSEDQVMALWSGLGYYARARNLLKAARIATEDSANLPEQVDGLMALPGIGRSTAGAIVSLAGNLPAAILDGNVKRVLCRFFAIDGWPGEAKTNRKLWTLSEKLLPSDQPRKFNQAMMDLGATICTLRNPACDKCPLAENCEARSAGNQAQYPQARRPPKRPIRDKDFYFMVDEQRRVLLEKRPASGIWGALWSVPESKPGDIYMQDDDGEANPTPYKHQFTHFTLVIHPHIIRVKCPPLRVSETEQVWLAAQKIDDYGLPRPIRQFLLAHIWHEEKL